MPHSSAAVAEVQYLLRVPPMEGPVVRDLASWDAGTLLFQGDPDAGWVAVEAEGMMGAGKLLGFDPAARIDLPGGTRDYLLQFSNLERVDRLALRQQAAAGVVRVYSADAPYPLASPRWQSLNGASGMGSGSFLNVFFPVQSTRFLRVSFESPEPLTLGPIFLSGDILNEDGGSVIPPPDQWTDSTDRVEFDFARLAAGGRIAYVGSGKVDDSYRMVDSDPTTFFEFDSVGRDAFFIVALAEAYPVYQASIATMEAIGSVEIWTFAGYPAEFLAEDPDGGEAGGLAIPGEFFSQRAATGRVEVPDNEEVTFLSIALPDPTARYLLVRVVGRVPDEPIRVSLFAVLGRVPREYLGNRGDRGNRPSFAQPVVDPLQLVDPPRVRFASP